MTYSSEAKATRALRAAERLADIAELVTRTSPVRLGFRGSEPPLTPDTPHQRALSLLARRASRGHISCVAVAQDVALRVEATSSKWREVRPDRALRDGDRIVTRVRHASNIYAAAITTSHIAVGGAATSYGRPAEADITVWEATTGARVGRLSGLRQSIQAVALSPDGRQVAALDSRAVVAVWDLESGQRVSRTSRIVRRAHSWPKWGLNFEAGGLRIDTDRGQFRLTVGSTVEKVSTTPGAIRQRPTLPGQPRHRLIPDGRGLRVDVVPAPSVQAPAALPPSSSEPGIAGIRHDAPVYAIHARGKHLALGGGRTGRGGTAADVSVFEWESGDRVGRYEGLRRSVQIVALSADGLRVAALDERSVAVVWEVTSGRTLVRSKAIVRRPKNWPKWGLIFEDGGSLRVETDCGALRLTPPGGDLRPILDEEVVSLQPYRLDTDHIVSSRLSEGRYRVQRSSTGEVATMKADLPAGHPLGRWGTDARHTVSLPDAPLAVLIARGNGVAVVGLPRPETLEFYADERELLWSEWCEAHQAAIDDADPVERTRWEWHDRYGTHGVFIDRGELRWFSNGSDGRGGGGTTQTFETMLRRGQDAGATMPDDLLVELVARVRALSFRAVT